MHTVTRLNHGVQIKEREILHQGTGQMGGAALIHLGCPINRWMSLAWERLGTGAKDEQT